MRIPLERSSRSVADWAAVHGLGQETLRPQERQSLDATIGSTPSSLGHDVPSDTIVGVRQDVEMAPIRYPEC